MLSNLQKTLRKWQQNQELIRFDSLVFEHFRYLAKKANKPEEFKTLSLTYKSVYNDFATKQKVYNDLLVATNFIHAVTPFEVIKKKIVEVKKEEDKFKDCLTLILASNSYSEIITEDMKSSFG